MVIACSASVSLFETMCSQMFVEVCKIAELESTELAFQTRQCRMLAMQVVRMSAKIVGIRKSFWTYLATVAVC